MNNLCPWCNKPLVPEGNTPFHRVYQFTPVSWITFDGSPHTELMHTDCHAALGRMSNGEYVDWCAAQRNKQGVPLADQRNKQSEARAEVVKPEDADCYLTLHEKLRILADGGTLVSEAGCQFTTADIGTFDLTVRFKKGVPKRYRYVWCDHTGIVNLSPSPMTYVEARDTCQGAKWYERVDSSEV